MIWKPPPHRGLGLMSLSVAAALERETDVSLKGYVFPKKGGQRGEGEYIQPAGRPQSLTNYPSNIVASQILTPRGSNTCGCRCRRRWSLAPASSSIHPLLEIMMGIDRIEGRKRGGSPLPAAEDVRSLSLAPPLARQRGEIISGLGGEEIRNEGGKSEHLGEETPRTSPFVCPPVPLAPI